jgi:hypothetical protein
MPSDVEVFQRQRKIERWLLMGVDDVSWMAKQFGVCERTVERDIEEVRISWKKIAQECWSVYRRS